MTVFIRLIVLLSLAISTLVACTREPTEEGMAGRRAIRQTLELLSVLGNETAAQHPEYVTWARPEGDELNAVSSAQLSDRSQAAFERRRLALISAIGKLDGLSSPPSRSQAFQWLDSVSDAYQRTLDMARYGTGRISLSEAMPYTIDPFGGGYLETVDLLLNAHSIQDEESVEAYLSRLSRLATEIEDERLRLRADSLSDFSLPAPLMEATERRIAELVKSPISSHPLVLDLHDQMRSAGMEQDLAAAYRDEAHRILEQQTFPAFARLRATLNALKTSADTQIGVWRHPAGERFYNTLLAFQTGRRPNLELVRAEAQTLVTALRSDLTNKAAAAGYMEGDLKDRLSSWQQDRMQATHLTGEPVEGQSQQPLSALSSKLSAWRSGSSTFIDTIHHPNMLVSPMNSTMRARQGPIAYWGSALDGSKPARLYVSEKFLAEHYERSLGYMVSRTWPGEHMQTSAIMRSNETPLVVNYIAHPAFIEGWRAYSLDLSASPQFSSNDIDLNIGISRARIELAAAAVIDIDIHLNRVSRAKAIEYLSENALLSEKEAADHVDRIASRPGVAVSAMDGLLTLRALKQRAQEILEDDFDLVSFHEVILLPGPRPFTQVEKDLETWLETQL